ncbi:MAG: hypothetical protein JWO57_4426 [Pseudonocardiales bacterium]|nr:hypothetical protein [Pseudonocardiales bacterium]
MRRLYSDSTLTIEGIRQKLRNAYPDQADKYTHPKVAKLVEDKQQTYSWDEVVDLLGLTGPATAVDTGSSATLDALEPRLVPQPQKPISTSAPITSAVETVVKVTQSTPILTAPLSSPLTATLAPSDSFDINTLQEQVRSIFAGAKKKGAPSKEEIMAVIGTSYTSAVVESAAFTYAFQDAVRAMIPADSKNQKFLENSALTDLNVEPDIDVAKYKMGDMSKWRLRHYTTAGTDKDPPPFKKIKSAMAVNLLPKTASAEEAASDAGVPKAPVDTRKSGHTGDRDWNRYGNTANTFYVLVLDGKLPEKQKFLENTKWYAEITFDQPNLWVSSDWLDEQAMKGYSFRGSGKAVQKQLLKLGGPVAGDLFRRTLMNYFNNLEVKIPGTVEVDTWHKA